MLAVPGLRRLVLATLSAMLPFGLLSAQSPIRLTASREVVAAAAQNDLTEVGTMLRLANGDIVITQYREALVRRIGMDGRMTTLGRPGEGPGEFRIPTIAGTLGDTFWVGDVRLRRTTFYRPDRTVLRTVPYPDASRASDGKVRWSMLLPLAYLSDGGVLVDGLHDASGPRPAWATAMQWAGTVILRLTPGGTIARAIAWLPPNQCSESVPIPGGEVIVRVPFCAGSPMHVDPTGRRLTVAVSGKAPGTTRVVVLAANADTLIQRELSLAPVPIPAAVRDSARAEAAKGGARGAEFDRVMRRMPVTYPAISRVLNGRDGTTWFEVATASREREWQMLDGAGKLTATVRIPRAVTISVAERGMLLGVETDADGLMQVVRFRLAPGR